MASGCAIHYVAQSSGHGAPVSCVEYCESNFFDCDGDPTNGCETPIMDAANCGRCGRQCAPTQACVRDDLANSRFPTGGSYWNCELKSCVAWDGDCDGDVANGCEPDRSSSGAHCGVCRHACAPDYTCQAGQRRCPEGQHQCFTGCVLTSREVCVFNGAECHARQCPH